MEGRVVGKNIAFWMRHSTARINNASIDDLTFRLFGPSATLCNGNEINGETCMLTPDLHCISCEEVTDYCACVNSNNACTYINGKCKSNFCQSYNLQEECELQGRCYWSSKDKICRRICPQYIRQEQCEAFPEECHWNPYLRNCV